MTRRRSYMRATLITLTLFCGCSRGSSLSFNQTDRRPIITSINGNGAAVENVGRDVNASSVGNYIKDGLIINGVRLRDSQVSLTERCSTPPCAVTMLALRTRATDTEIAADLPDAFINGDYVLQVSTPLGSTDANVSILQGEPGVCSESLCSRSSFPGASVITQLNLSAASTFAASSVSGFSRIGLARNDTSNEAELVSDGFYLMGLYRDTHEPIADSRFNRAYSTSSVDITAFHSALTAAQGDRSFFIVVVSRGDVVAALSTGSPSVANRLISLGAGSSLGTATAQQAFIMVGYGNLGAGNGVFAMSRSNGTAEALVILADGAFVGPRGVDAAPPLSAGAGLNISPSGEISLEPGVGIPADGILLSDIADNACSADEVIKRTSDNLAWECALPSAGAQSNIIEATQPILDLEIPGADAVFRLAYHHPTRTGQVVCSNVNSNTCQTIDITAPDHVTIGHGMHNTTFNMDGTITTPARSLALQSLASTGCTADQVLQWTGTAWQCGDVTVDQLADDSVTTDQLADNAVTSNQIQNGTITFADIGPNSCSADQVIKRRSDNTAWECADPSTPGVPTEINIVEATRPLLDFETPSADGVFRLAYNHPTRTGQVHCNDVNNNTCTGINISASDNVTINHGGAQTIFHAGGAITLPEGSIELGSLGSTGCSGQQVARWNGITWACSEVDSAMITNATIAGEDIANGTITLNKLAAGACTSGQVARYNGTTWECATPSGSLPTGCANNNIATYSTAGSGSWNCASSLSSSTVFASGYLQSPLVSTNEIRNYTVGWVDLNIRHSNNAVSAFEAGGDLRVSGCVKANGQTIGVCTSDRRLKDNIEYFEFGDALSKVTQIHPATFTFKSDPTKRTEVGVIAQDIQAFAPELVTTDEAGSYRVAYGKLDWLVIEAMAELNGKNDTLQTRVESLEAQLKEQSASLQQQQEVIDAILKRFEAR